LETETKTKEKQEKPLGVDLSTTSLKIVQLDEQNVLKEYGIFDLPVSPNDTDIILGLKGLLNKKFTTKNAVVGLRGLDVLTKLIRVKYGDYADVEKQVEKILLDFLPIDRDAVEVSWEVIGQVDDLVDLLLIVIPKNVLERYERLLAGAGLKILAAEINALAVKRAAKLEKSEQVEMVIDMHADETNIVIYNRGVLLLDKTIPKGGMAITRLMSRKMTISVVEAEKQKRDSKSVDEKVFHESYKPVADLILAEVGRVMSIASLDYDLKVEKIWLCGGDFNADNLREYFIHNLSEFIDTQLFIPSGVDLSQNITKESGDCLRLVNAIGLAMKY